MSILQVLNEYRGEGFLLVLYGISLVCLLIREKEPVRRTLLVDLPLVFLVLFFLPPVHALTRSWRTPPPITVFCG